MMQKAARQVRRLSAHLPCRCYMLEARKECGDHTSKLSATIESAGFNPGDRQKQITECPGAAPRRAHHASGARCQHPGAVCGSPSHPGGRTAPGNPAQSRRSQAEHLVLSNPGPARHQQSSPRSATDKVLELRLFHTWSDIRDALR